MWRYILAILGLGSAVSGSFARREVFSRDMSACRGVFWVWTVLVSLVSVSQFTLVGRRANVRHARLQDWADGHLLSQL